MIYCAMLVAMAILLRRQESVPDDISVVDFAGQERIPAPAENTY